MTHFSDLQAFLRAVRAAPDMRVIGATMSDATRQFGFDYFVMAQAGAAILSDFPAAWRDALGTAGDSHHDAVSAASEVSTAPFAWSDLPGLMTMTAQQRAYMATAASLGLSAGYTVPIHAPGAPPGHCSFVTIGDRPLPATSLSAVHYLACFASEAVRRLAIARVEAAGMSRLTSRQPDCVVRIGRGRANRAPGRAGVSGRTEPVRLVRSGQPSVPG